MVYGSVCGSKAKAGVGHKSCIFIIFLLICSFLSGETFSQSANQILGAPNNGRFTFPRAYRVSFIDEWNAWDTARPYWVPTQAEQSSVFSPPESVLLNNDILAYYGHPNSRIMGILGRYAKEEINEQLTVLAREYSAVNSGRGITKAFYIIFGTVWPEGEIGIIGERLLTEYIEYALVNDILVFLDHQIGRYDPITSLRRMLPWLRYPNVHLALDPEWRTTMPMVEIGTISAEEVNEAQRIMENYIIENNIPGERLLVIHQFHAKMISERRDVRANFERVRLVHCMDGFGSPAIKRDSYSFNAAASNIPVKAFKLFYNSGIAGTGYDNPLLTPKEVMELNPKPYIIMYQ